MWSSLTAIYGVATQSNYLATCAFMDSFARYRRSIGLTAVSLNLGHIADTGNIRRNPSLADSLTRNGLYGNKHSDFLKFCDAALAPPTEQTTTWYPGDFFVSAQILAGVGPSGLRDVNYIHPLKDMSWYRDPRFSFLIKASKYDAIGGVDAQVDEEIESTQARSIADRIQVRLAQLLFISPQDIKLDKPVTYYGIDSLIAAELRKWLSMSFGTAVSTMDILDSETSTHDLEAEILRRGAS